MNIAEKSLQQNAAIIDFVIEHVLIGIDGNTHCQTKYSGSENSFLLHPFAPLTFEKFAAYRAAGLSILQIFCVYQRITKLA